MLAPDSERVSIVVAFKHLESYNIDPIHPHPVNSACFSWRPSLGDHPPGGRCVMTESTVPLARILPLLRSVTQASSPGD